MPSIRSHVYRDSLTVNQSRNQPSPVAGIEHVILEVVKWKQEAGQPITTAEGMELSNSLINGKLLQDKLKIFQRSRKKSPTSLLSRKY